MGDGNHRALILLQMLFQPVDGFGIEMVGRLVEQQHIGLLKQQPAEGHTTTLTTREILHAPVAWRTVQCRHRTVELGIHIPGIRRVDDILQFGLTLHQLVHLVRILVVFRQSELHVNLVVFGQRIVDVLYTLHDILFHRLLLVERRILRQITHGIARTPYHVALILLVEPGDNFHERGLTGTVQADDADLCPVEETEVDILEHLFLVLLDGLAHTNHREDDLLVVDCCHNVGP